MRALFTTQPAYGHYHPLAPLTKALVEHGHEAVVATGESFAKVISGSGIETAAAGIDWEETDGGLVKAFPELWNHPGTEKGNQFVIGDIYAQQTALAMVPDLLALIEEWRPDVVVRGTFEFGGALAAELAGLPHVTVQVAAHAVFETNRAPLLRGLKRSREQLGLEPVEDLSFLFRHLLLSFVPPSLQESQFPLPANSRVLKAPVVDSYEPEAKPPWLDELPFERTVYMTMGTVFTGRLDPYNAVLEALSGEEVNLVLTVGRRNDPAVFGPQPQNVRIERYLPHSALLPHCDLVICHGGFNSILSALAHGIPLVLIPVSADQPDNARRCDALGASLTVPFEDVTPQSIRGATLEALGSEELREGALRIQREMMELPGIEHAVSLLEELVEREQRAAQATQLEPG